MHRVIDVVDISIPPPSFKPVSLSLSRSSLFQNTPNKSFFNVIKSILTSFTTLCSTILKSIFFVLTSTFYFLRLVSNPTVGSEVLLTVEEILLTDTRQSTGNSLHPFVGIQRGRVKSQFSNLLHVKKSDSRAINKTIHKNQTNNTVSKIQKAKERAVQSRIWKSTVVDISIPPPSFKPVSLFLSRSSLF